MRHEYNLGDLQRELAGWTPFVWRQQRAIESGATHNAKVDTVPAHVPGSVQGALLAGRHHPGLERRAAGTRGRVGGEPSLGLYRPTSPTSG